MTSDYDSYFVNGGWAKPSESWTAVDVRSASSLEAVGSFPRLGPGDVDVAVSAARAAFDDPQGWSHWMAAERAAVLEDVANRLDGCAEQIARLVSAQNGMPISTSRVSEARSGAALLRFYAAMIRDRDAEEIRVGATGRRNLLLGEPVGVVAAVVPWNFPQGITFTKLAPLLAAGCTAVVKPSEETALDFFVVAQAMAESALPHGVVNVVPGGRELGAYLVGHPGVDKVAFTGSTAAGRSVAIQCAELLRPVSLELGGKSAAIVLDDAALTARARDFRDATMRNNGQTCHLSTRILVPRSRYGRFLDEVTDIIGSQVVGDALDPETEIGPLVSAAQRDRVEGYIARGLAEGGRVTTGGLRPAKQPRGWFVTPTVIGDVHNSHTVAQEEIFGPVLCVIPYDDIADAIRIANDSEYGLGGTVWSSDEERATAVARGIRSGTVGINGYRSDPVVPFGGIKSSGYSRELGVEGLRSYHNLKSIFPPP